MGIPFVHVQAKGTHRELGRAVGEAAREQVQASVEFFRADFAAARDEVRATLGLAPLPVK